MPVVSAHTNLRTKLCSYKSEFLNSSTLHCYVNSMIFFSRSFFRGCCTRMSVPIMVSCEVSETGFGVQVDNGLMFENRKEKI